MVRQLRPTLMRCAVIGLAGLVSSPAFAAMAARGFGGHPGPKVIMAPRIVRNAPLRNTPISRNARHEIFDRHRFHRNGQFNDGYGGYGGTEVVPVPVEAGGGGGEAYPYEPSGIEYDQGYGGRRPVNPGPQIIILPDAAKRGGARAAAPEAARPAQYRTSRAHASGAPGAPTLHHYGSPFHRHHDFAGYGPGWPVYGEPAPIALAPCNDSAFAPIYNTPCGVRPYE